MRRRGGRDGEGLWKEEECVVAWRGEIAAPRKRRLVSTTTTTVVREESSERGCGGAVAGGEGRPWPWLAGAGCLSMSSWAWPPWPDSHHSLHWSSPCSEGRASESFRSVPLLWIQFLTFLSRPSSASFVPADLVPLLSTWHPDSTSWLATLASLLVVFFPAVRATVY